MSTSKPVVVYGASGYTGRLICEYLREFNLPFVAAGRDADRVQSVMDSLPGIETADYEVAGVEHTAAALTELFDGAKVVCNTVGPFADLGGEVVEACLASGCHYVDTTGEQNWILSSREDFGERFAEAGLLLSAGIAQMYTSGEIAANICLETQGVDTLDILVLWKGAPTTASTETIFTNLLSEAYFLEQNAYVAWPPPQGYEVSVPGQHATALTLPWGGTSHPAWFKDDPRVANVKVLGGVFDRALMEGVVQIAQMVEEKIKPLPADQQGPALAEVAATMKADMPPRENQRVNTSIDSVYATGPLGNVHCVLRGASNYKQTGLLQAYAARCLTLGVTRAVGFGSACQAFGHRELLGVLQSFGLSGKPAVTSSSV
ncbi:MAG: saccharopine dehydrogenase NADP-binding domain-containing protein [Thermoleophilaceae bacterium]|nr:saccharopine dehydrogenase NADP-binding domain-containing protein [Thermoleophilaceae bacterium]